MKAHIRPAISLFIVLSIITGLIYPLITMGIGKVAFPDQANGSIITKNNAIVGSSLIDQTFSGPSYFWGRPSTTSPMPYNGLKSGGSNFGPSNPAQKAAVADRVKALHNADPGNVQPIPVDLITASGSGLDAHISPAAANYQLQRVAKARNMTPKSVMELINKYTEAPQLGVFGEARVNVLLLNLALEEETQR